MKLYGETLVSSVVSITCDCCGNTYEDLMEMQEFLSYSDTCGYGAEPSRYHYADGDIISIDMCQYCKFRILGNYMRVERNDT